MSGASCFHEQEANAIQGAEAKHRALQGGPFAHRVWVGPLRNGDVKRYAVLKLREIALPLRLRVACHPKPEGRKVAEGVGA